jgi:hypothetical protein
MNWFYNTCIMKNSALIFKRICPKGFEDVQQILETRKGAPHIIIWKLASGI